MNTGKISARYAKALYEFAADANVADKVYETMKLVSAAFVNVDGLKDAIANPTISKDKKKELLTIMAGDSVCAEYTRFVDLVVENKREDNSITGKPYAESPAIMSWQISNEPRCFDPANKAVFKDWLVSTGELIKSIDSNHLVSTGSEGKFGCEGDIELWADIHNNPAIDYANIHIWPYNWRWVTSETLTDSLPNAFANTREYVESHRKLTTKPLVLEEFGYPRDSMDIAPGSPTTARDAYYKYVFDLFDEGIGLNGVNFWGWGGKVVPPHRVWEVGDPYTGDPAQEDQGLYSVFTTDSSTVAIIRNAAKCKL